MTSRAITVLTWNLLGARGLDVRAAAAAIRRSSPDIVLVQEVQRRQARRIAAQLGMSSAWRFKNFSWRTWAEGMAILSPHPVRDVRRKVLRRSWLWNWRRRILVTARVEVAGGVHVADVHLSAHAEAGARRRETTMVLDTVAPDAIVAGDFNDVPGGAAPELMAARGWRDAWAAANPTGDDEESAVGPGATNWSEGDRVGRPPTQRLDYIWVPGGFEVTAARVPVAAAELDDFARLSDHLPVVVSLRRSGGEP